MDLIAFKDYKAAIRARLEELKASRPGLTLKRVAERIPIQYTYLSKVLNDADAHLSEDDLFQVAQILEMYPQETEYLMQLRAWQSARHPARREFLVKTLDRSRKQLKVRAKIEGGSKTLERELSHLLDPYSVVTYVALHLSHIQSDPRLLCEPLGISRARLGQTLKNLALLELIELGTGPLTVLQVRKSNPHYSKDHPLMRTHQYLLKIAAQSQLLRLGENDKESFQATFTADAAAYEDLRAEFHAFLKKVQERVRTARDERVYQLSFDLFPWT
jgi:uncharacterized protein (TIGR02147 family)